MKVSGAKAIKNKSIKSETLPSRMSPATITGGDVMKRMGNYYGKEAHAGAQTSPSSVQLYALVGRRFGMA